MKPAALEQQQLDHIDHLLLHDLEYKQLSPQTTTDAEHLAHEKDRIRTCLSAGGWAWMTPTALILIKALPWDTHHFSRSMVDIVRIYRTPTTNMADTHSLLQWVIEDLADRKIDFASARLLATDWPLLHLLQQQDFQLMDVSVEVGCRLSSLSANHVQSAFSVRTALPSDAGAVCEIASTFVDNRFFRDSQLPPDKCTELYQKWAIAALNGQHGQMLVAADSDDHAIGFTTYQLPSSPLQISLLGLIAVSPKHRRQGVLQQLVAGGMRHIQNAAPHTQCLFTSTQLTNYGALRGFNRCGLQAFNTRFILHKWLND